MALIRFFYVIPVLLATTWAVDKGNFKTCEQSSFCRRLRGIEKNDLKYKLDLSSLQVTDNAVEAELVNTENDVKFKFVLTAIAGSTFRILVDEANPLHSRYKVTVAFSKEPQLAKLNLLERTDKVVTVQSGNNKVIVSSHPFRITFFEGPNEVAVINSRGLFEIEHLRTKLAEDENAENAPKEDPGAWEENFKTHHDSKPRGPEAVAVDISFPGAHRAYGLPEHADKLPLSSTGPGGLEPYRLYNLDVFEYEVHSTMALYGAVPVLYAHSPKNTVGVYWNNAAETWVDVSNSKDVNVVSSIVNLVSGQGTPPQVDTHFMSESGIVDLFVLLGPTPGDAVRQYAALTGVAPLPPDFSLGYHQCRWNYNDEEDLQTVVKKFDDHDFPMDLMWLDIEYTDGKKYFTWDSVKFPHPEQMQRNLTATGRKLVLIIDPHIKREGGYFLHEDALSNDLYVKTKDGAVYEGWCWPGSSSYLDLLDPRVQDYYKKLYSFDNFKGTTEIVHIWNDMNEPSVFNGPEVTMPKDVLHYGGWEHRHIHNIYGLLYTMITYEGLTMRSPNSRPFILTRAHFAGSQRFAAVWTGDNDADWSHLRISFAMCLSEALAGISFCGADIGGFFRNPDAELLLRWYQVGAWLPFYRSHAHIDTKRREPYLFPDDVQNRIRFALKLRYAHLPYWYTLFFEHERTGDPVIRPLFYHFPQEADTYDLDHQLMAGSGILVRLVGEPGATNANVYLPGGAEELWYDINDYRAYTGKGNINVPVTLDTIPIYYRGGSIIPRKDRPRRASSVAHNDPYTLYVVLDKNGKASGTLYADDGFSFDYRNNVYVYMRYSFSGDTLTSTPIADNYQSWAWLERVIILGAPKNVAYAEITPKNGAPQKLQTSYDGDERSLTIRKPGLNIREEYKIVLRYRHSA